jgi:hypothetical protein
MREFKVGDATSRALVSPYIRMLAGGGSTAGKTHFAATFPKPLFISDLSEGGFNTLQSMNRDLWWDPKVAPEVHAIEHWRDLLSELTKLEALASGKFPWKTVAMDAISIYAERVLVELKAAQPDIKDPRQYYGQLKDILAGLVQRVNRLPAHVIWLCHVTEDGGLALPGKSAAVFPAYMDRKVLCRVQTLAGRAANYELRTRPFGGSVWVGGRGAVLPDPFMPSFKAFAQVLRLPEKPASPTCPDFMGQDYSNGVAYV